MLDKDGSLIFRKLVITDLSAVHEYLLQLSDDTKKRFGPHGFDMKSLEELYRDGVSYAGYIAQDQETGKILAYNAVKLGYLEHDSERLRAYGMMPDHRIDCTFAPSVSDEWQGRGIGKRLFQHMLEDLRKMGRRRVILWGGVQKTNERALKFYLGIQFRILGEFEYKGWNYDMIYLVP